MPLAGRPFHSVWLADKQLAQVKVIKFLSVASSADAASSTHGSSPVLPWDPFHSSSSSFTLTNWHTKRDVLEGILSFKLCSHWPVSETRNPLMAATKMLGRFSTLSPKHRPCGVCVMWQHFMSFARIRARSVNTSLIKNKTQLTPAPPPWAHLIIRSGGKALYVRHRNNTQNGGNGNRSRHEEAAAAQHTSCRT